jgi:hypothetical protein
MRAGSKFNPLTLMFAATFRLLIAYRSVRARKRARRLFRRCWLLQLRPTIINSFIIERRLKAALSNVLVPRPVALVKL